MENNDIPAAKHHTAIAVERPFRHSITVQLRFNDFDMLGHLNNSMYFSYFDIGKAEYFNTIRHGKHHWGRVDVVIANVNCDFIAPIYFTERIVVKTQIAYFHDKIRVSACCKLWSMRIRAAQRLFAARLWLVSTRRLVSRLRCHKNGKMLYRLLRVYEKNKYCKSVM